MEEKIRLAVFGQKRLSREGGIEIVVKELCTRMAQNGCDVTCYNRAEKELAVVQEELQQKKQIAGNTEVLLTVDNLLQYVKKIEVEDFIAVDWPFGVGLRLYESKMPVISE